LDASSCGMLEMLVRHARDARQSPHKKRDAGEEEGTHARVHTSKKLASTCKKLASQSPHMPPIRPPPFPPPRLLLVSEEWNGLGVGLSSWCLLVVLVSVCLLVCAADRYGKGQGEYLLLHMELTHVVNNLENYMMHQVHSDPPSRLQPALDAAHDLDEIAALHRKFLERLRDR